jgi:hypothetical protein
VINIIYRRPEFTPHTFVRLGYGSYEYLHGELFSTGAIVKDQLAYLANVNLKSSDNWRDWVGNNERNAMFALTFLPYRPL